MDSEAWSPWCPLRDPDTDGDSDRRLGPATRTGGLDRAGHTAARGGCPAPQARFHGPEPVSTRRQARCTRSPTRSPWHALEAQLDEVGLDEGPAQDRGQGPDGGGVEGLAVAHAVVARGLELVHAALLPALPAPA